MAKKVVTDDQPRVYFDCTKCPAFCCAVYERVTVTKRDINRLAKHFGVTVESAVRRFTKMNGDERVLRRKPDPILDESCMFLDRETRGCSIYHARPAVCREYPDRTRCAYYDLYRFERRQQADDDTIPLVQITFREMKKKEPPVSNGNGHEQVWVWEPER